MNFQGLVVGLTTFIIIGLFHPMVIKAEYYWGAKRSRWVFAMMAVSGGVASVLTSNIILSVCCGVFAFSSLWSIKEVIEQEERFRKGWFPSNPKKKKTNVEL